MKKIALASLLAVPVLALAADPVKPAAGGAGLLKLDCSNNQAALKEPLCRRPNKEHPRGSGPSPKDLPGFGNRFLGGTIDGNTVYVGVAFGESGAIVGVDLETGDRKVISGKMEDPAEGTVTVGEGPDFPNVYDVQKGPDGNLYAFGTATSSHPISLLRVDPKTGNRKLVWESANKEFGTCTMTHSGGTVRTPRPTNTHFAIGPGGFYMALQDNPMGVGHGIIRISSNGKNCEPISTFKVNTDPKFMKGKGPENIDTFRGLRFGPDGTLYAISTAAAQVWKFDVTTGDRKRVSSAKVPALGTGPQDIGRGQLVWDPHNKVIWTAGVFAGQGNTLISIDPTTGNRTAVELKGPAGAGNQGWGGLWVHPTKPLLVMGTDDFALTLIDPKTGNSNLLSM